MENQVAQSELIMLVATSAHRDEDNLGQAWLVLLDDEVVYSSLWFPSWMLLSC